MAMRSSALPLLVSDIGISEAMTINNDGDAALRVEGGASAWTSEQAAQVTETVGTRATPHTSSINGRLNSIQDATGTQADDDTTPTIIGLLKSIATKLQ